MSGHLMCIVVSTVLVEVAIGIVPLERLPNTAVVTIVITEAVAQASIITITDRTKAAMKGKLMVEIDMALQVADTPQAGVLNSRIIFSHSNLLLRRMIVKLPQVRLTNLGISKTKEGLNIKTTITT